MSLPNHPRWDGTHGFYFLAPYLNSIHYCTLYDFLSISILKATSNITRKKNGLYDIIVVGHLLADAIGVTYLRLCMT